jgi:hypothetical protein
MLAKLLFSLLKSRSSASIILEDGAPFARPFVLLLLTLKSRSKNAPRTCQQRVTTSNAKFLPRGNSQTASDFKI